MNPTNRGQLSFDLIFSIVAAMVLMQAVSNVLPELQGAPVTATIQAQHAGIEKSLESIAMASGSLKEGSLYLEYRIPSIRGKGFKEVPCTISIENGLAIVFTPSNPSNGIPLDVNTAIDNNVLHGAFGQQKMNCGKKAVLIDRS